MKQTFRMLNRSINVRSTASSGSHIYETQRAVDEYLLFHYGQADTIAPFNAEQVSFALNFSRRCAELTTQAVMRHGSKHCGRILDLGCAVGGLSFELTRTFHDVLGIDYSEHFIETAKKLKSEGKLSYKFLKQGNLFFDADAVIPDDINRSKVCFRTGDACNLSTDIGQFDAIVGSNLLCRLPQPKKFLSDVPQFLRPGGLLILISPYSWLEEYTKCAEWVGASCDGDVESFEALKSILVHNSEPLELVHRENISFIIREHERKYQLGISDVTVWKRSN